MTRQDETGRMEAMSDVGSTVPRRELGRLLRQLREQAGIGLEAAGSDLEWSRAKMYRIEAGQTPVRALDVEQMCRLYGASKDMTEVVTSLAKESKSKGWYHAYGEVIPRWFELYVGLEAAASRIRMYEHALVPGLLQTLEYAAEAVHTRPNVSAEEASKLVELRIERQRLLARRRPAAPTLDVIIEEALLHKSVPGMAGQIDKLIDANDVPNVCLRVLPLNGKLTQVAVSGGFVILDFPTTGARSAEPTTVYNEGLSGALYIDRIEEVRAYAEVWNQLNAQALSVEESRLLMQRVKERHHG
ncbi:helix-turn-helix transcriptional regulator [Micromonospora sp. WMMD1082]|uniref:helix-turn-helix domain-containing protein n=1 Tax=Micromonospora sp. WMMD1082 TaxID=3016104 RepID=UPI002417332B|nr:helix-turn-helix transcriptional regulator [Micromonospora sp. WMMD1082]MDG4797835.1 helix-turn-helix transcriptional regulator [Micromonospora sp. WMMD1082]